MSSSSSSSSLETAIDAWASVDAVGRAATRRGERVPLEAIASAATVAAIAATPIRALCAWSAREGQKPQRVVTLVAGGRHYPILPAALGGYARHRQLVAKADTLAVWGTAPSFPTTAWGEGNLRHSVGGHCLVAEVML